ncbi:nuclear polyadenylated RNA-binding protein 3-like [Culex quinquefasciatus]|uniref:nuclear polyadenylated RNA-binding protein 3-like n=1 Tax=Culex quinquefasciatus TaxID=7176 RepID=UPI0018E2EFB4|nr:nuclear polyadenylated RNA-binding protein 3-like [Culex quinquefasciatus]
MLKCLIVLCVGTLLTVVVESAPAPQTQNPIDFLLDLNQDVLDKEVPASVKPISQAQIGTTTEKNDDRKPAPVFEDQAADVREIPGVPAPTASQLNTDHDQGEEEQEDREEEVRSDSEDESEQKEQPSTSKDDDQDVKNNDQDSKDDDQDSKDEDKEDTTIRVYGPEDDENGEEQHDDQKHQDQGSERKAEPEVQRQPQEDSRQPEVEISQHADTVKQFDEVVDQRGTDLLPEVNHQVTIPDVISEQPDSLDDKQEIEVKPDQLFNHGSIVFDKSTFATDEDLPSTTPFNGKKWNHDNGPSGFGPWHPKFPGFPGHTHDHDHDEGRPPFFGMPPFNGPPPRFDGPPHWHFHNHSHEHRDWHQDHDHGFHGHGFHRRGPWKWNRS